MTYRIHLDAGTYLNSNDRKHFHAKAPITAGWRATAATAATQAEIPQLDRAHIVVTFTFKDKRRRDVGNLYPTAKAIVDGIVDAGVLVDDDDAHLLGPDLRRGYGDPGVLVQITPLDGAA